MTNEIVANQSIKCGQELAVRGGVLDFIAKILSLGYFGVETTKIYGWLENNSGKYYPPNVSPMEVATSEGRQASCDDFNKTEHIKHLRIVKNR